MNGKSLGLRQWRSSPLLTQDRLALGALVFHFDLAWPCQWKQIRPIWGLSSIVSEFHSSTKAFWVKRQPARGASCLPGRAWSRPRPHHREWKLVFENRPLYILYTDVHVLYAEFVDHASVTVPTLLLQPRTKTHFFEMSHILHSVNREKLVSTSPSFVPQCSF